ncbi:MAG: leucine-rich repeat domain-containing protein [Spirochaetaceae bacterium]|nr:leucine-rich repeat domain-containing protein [Spirochaetaceae bacterium]
MRKNKSIVLSLMFLVFSVVAFAQTGTNAIDAQNFLQKGITAENAGNIVEALDAYFQAQALDPKLADATKRATTLSASVSAGDIGVNVRNDIQLRNEWLKILRQAVTYYNTTLQKVQYYIYYDPVLAEGEIDYDKETVDLSYVICLSPQFDSTFVVLNKVIDSIKAGLNATGRAGNWKFESWPSKGGSLPADAVLNSINKTFKVASTLKNGNITLATADVSFGVTISNNSFTPEITNAVFKNVNANDISDNMSVTIDSVNGIPAAQTGKNSITIATINCGESGIAFTKERRNSWGNYYTVTHWKTNEYDFTFNITGITLVKYNGSDKKIIIPNKIGPWPITELEGYADSSVHGVYNRIDTVIMPDSITKIGNYVFGWNNLTNVTIPDGVTIIGDRAFASNKLTSIVIPDSVTFIDDTAFSGNQLTSITIGDNVLLGYYPFDEEFIKSYDTNGRKAGVYTRNGKAWIYKGP